MAKTAAAAALGAAATVPVELFSYNKENFHFDAELRFQRFVSAYNYAIEQVEQYRQDVEDIVSNTMMKMDAWQSVLVLFLGEGAVLCTFGRLGLEGPALPSWHGALYTGSLFGSILMNGLSLWLAMHASLRAQCAATSLLTRKVRLPIPALSQLDNARVFGSAFEKQEYRDIFRIPFMRHPHQAPDMPKLRQGGRGSPKGKSPRSVYVDDPHDTFGSTARDTVPSWIRDEVAVDKGGHDIHVPRGDTPEADDLPEHFGLLMEAQKEWRDYEIYARVSMLFGVMFWLHALCYFTIGSCVAEARGLWVMWSTPMLFVTAQVLILRLNIVRSSQGNHRAPHLEWLGHIAPYFAVVGNTLEYRQYYSETQESVAWAFGFAALLGHLTMALRMLDLSSRRAHEPMEEVPGKQWWPHKWHVPSAFTKHLWFITPPIKLEPGQHCLLHEMRSFAARGGGVTNTCRRRRPSSPRRSLTSGSLGSNSLTSGGGGTIVPPQDQKGSARADMPYFLLRTALLSITVQWLFIMAASAATMIMGSEELLKPPGLPPWIRDIKHRGWAPDDVHLSNSKLPSDYRLFPDWQDPLHLHLEEDHHASDADHGAAHGGLKQEAHAGAHHSQVVSEEQADQAQNASFATEQVQGAGYVDEIAGSQGEGVGYVDAAAGGYRRLGASSAQFADPVLGELRQLMPLLGELFDRVEREGRGEEYLAAGDLMQAGTSPGGFMAPALLEARNVAWPPLFEPQHLLCWPGRSDAGPAGVLAMTPRGFGAQVPAAGGEAQPFSLQGVDGLLAGAAWAESGLYIVTRAGKLLHCPGGADGGSWPCRDSGHAALPVPKGSALLAAALSVEKGGAVSTLAALFSHMPDAALLFRSAGAGAGWEPAAGTHAPQGTAHLAFDGEELLMSAPRGDLHRWHPGTGLTSTVRLSTSAGGARELRATCAPGAGALLHLALRAPSAGAGGAWRPELLAAPR